MLEAVPHRIKKMRLAHKGERAHLAAYFLSSQTSRTRR